jgi:catechol 2,3-dioxygenase-like lactoylglutathione lyase family enzyme
VSAALEADMELSGIGYPAVIVQNMQESVEFYGKLGGDVLYTEPNRDDPESIQSLVHLGAENYLMLIGPTDPSLKLAEATLGVGSMQYLTLRVSAAFMDQAFFTLSSVGLQGSEEIRRGYERLIFLEDPNGTLMLLVAWATEPPAGMDRNRVLARAAEFRAAEGARFLEEVHVQRAIAALQATS